MGAFDDLIPSQPSASVPLEPKRGFFNDLLPKEQEPVGTVRGFFGALQRGVKQIQALPDTLALTNVSGLDDNGIAAYRAHRIGQLTGEAGPQVIERTQRAAADRVAQRQAEIDAVPRSEAQQNLERAEGWREKFKAWLKDPIELTASIAAESLPASVAGAVGGAVVGGVPGMVAGVGLSSGLMTFSGELLGNAASRGIDLKDPKAIGEWLRSDAYEKDADSALTKAVTVGAIDAATAGVAGRFVVPAIKTGLMRNVAVASAKELGLQAGAGAGGEALGSIAAGQKVDPFNVFAEAVAEVASGPGEAASTFRSRSRRLRSMYRAPETPRSTSMFEDLIPKEGQTVERPIEPATPPPVPVPVQPVETVAPPQRTVPTAPQTPEVISREGGVERAQGQEERPEVLKVSGGETPAAPVIPRLLNKFVWSGESLGTEPVIAFRMRDGRVLADDTARIHAQAYANMGLTPADGTVEQGFVVGNEFVPGSQSGDMRNVRDAQARARELAEPAVPAKVETPNAPTPEARPADAPSGTAARPVEPAVERTAPVVEPPRKDLIVGQNPNGYIFDPKATTKELEQLRDFSLSQADTAKTPNGRARWLGIRAGAMRELETRMAGLRSAEPPAEPGTATGERITPALGTETLVERPSETVKPSPAPAVLQSVSAEQRGAQGETDVVNRLRELRAERSQILKSVGGNLNNAASSSQIGGLAPTKIRYQAVSSEIASLEAQLKKLRGKPDVRIVPKVKGGSITRPKGTGLLLEVYSNAQKVGEIGRDNLGKLYAVREGSVVADGFNTVTEARDALLQTKTPEAIPESGRVADVAPQAAGATQPRELKPAETPAKAQAEIAQLKQELAKEQKKLDREVNKVGSMRPPAITAELTRTIATRMAKIQDKIDALEKGNTPHERSISVGRGSAGSGQSSESGLHGRPNVQSSEPHARSTFGTQPSVGGSERTEAIRGGSPQSETGTGSPATSSSGVSPSVRGKPAIGKTATPAAAQSTMQAQVSSVARTEGARPAKEIKSELIQRLEEAIEKAPAEPEAMTKLREEWDKADRNNRSKAKESARNDMRKLSEKLDKVTIEIPGDGTFTVLNNKYAIGELLKRAQKLSTSTAPTKGYTESGISKSDRDWVAAQMKSAQQSSVASGVQFSNVPAPDENLAAQDQKASTDSKVGSVPEAAVAESAGSGGEVLWASPDEVGQVLTAERGRRGDAELEGRGVSTVGQGAIRAGAEQASGRLPAGTRFVVERTAENESARTKGVVDFLTARLLRGDDEGSAAAQFNRTLFDKLTGLKVVFRELGENAEPANATGESIVVNTSKFRFIDHTKPEAVAYLDSLIAEELLHAATFRLSSADEIVSVWRSLTGQEQLGVRGIYQKPLNDYSGGAEYIRLILQERLRGEVTETHGTEITKFAKELLKKLVALLKQIFGQKPENDIARQVIERIEAAIRGEPPIDGNVFGATQPVESGTRHIADILQRGDIEDAGDDYIPTEVFGIRDKVLDKTQYTDEQRAKSIGIAKAAFDESGLKVTRDGDGHFQLSGGKENNPAGRKLVDIVRREIAKYGQGSLEVTELVQSLVLDFKNGRMDELFSTPIRNQLYSLAQGERSFRGVSLNALRGAGEDIRFVSQNIDVHLQRVWHEAYGGQHIDSALGKIREKFKAFFTPEVIQEIVQANPLLRKMDGAAKIVSDGLNTDFANLTELRDFYVAALRAANPKMIEKDALALARQITEALRPRVRVAAQKATQETEPLLSTDEVLTMKGRKPIWQKLVDAVQRGEFDNTSLVREKATLNGWKPPSDADVARIKRLAQRERELHQLTQKELEAAAGDQSKLRREQIVRDEATLPRRVPLMREMEAAWAAITKPVNFGRGLWTNRANNAAFLNELVSANLLLRLSFAPKQAISVLSQFFVHLPTRAIGQAIELHSQSKALNRETALRNDIYNSMTGAFQSALTGYKDGATQFVAALRGRGEVRNVDRLMSGISAIERIDAQAKRYKEQGQTGRALLFRLLSFIRLGYRIAQAFDNLHGVPSEYIELRHQAVMSLMKNGVERAAANAQADNIIESIKKEHVFAVAQAKAILESQGEEYNTEKLREISYRIARRWAYENMRQLGLPADDFAAQNRHLRETIGWNEREAGTASVGGVVGGTVAKLGKVGEGLGLPLALGRFGNAIAIGINRALHFTPMGFFPRAFGDNNAWFSSELDRNQRKVEATLGTTVGVLAFMLALSGAVVVRLRWPRDPEERDLFEAQGHRPGTLEIPNGDGTFSAVSLNTGFLSFLSPYLAAGGALRDLLDEREKQQAKLNADAAKKGLPAEDIRPMSMADMMGVAAQAGYQTLLGGRTSAGAVSALSDYGIPNVTKLAASQTAPLIPGLPALQEVSRMGGVVLDSKLATFTDFLLPSPSSPARRVNFLGDPSGTPDDMQRIVQVLTGGTYGPIDPNTAKAQNAYRVLFASGLRPGSINPNRGYAIGDSFRPFNNSELERYTELRGQEFKSALGDLPADADEKSIRAVFRSANQRALAKMGVNVGVRKTRRTRRRGLRSTRTRLRSLRTRRRGLRSLRSSRLTF